MSTSRAIQVSVTHAVLGISSGSGIEAMLPKFNEGVSLANLAFETLVQVGMNGAALATVANLLRDDDPTFGIPFSWALFQSQPELSRRIESLASAARDQFSQLGQRMAPRVAAV